MGTVYRSAVTGEYVTEEFAQAHPHTTVAETVEDTVPEEAPPMTEAMDTGTS